MSKKELDVPFVKVSIQSVTQDNPGNDIIAIFVKEHFLSKG